MKDSVTTKPHFTHHFSRQAPGEPGLRQVPDRLRRLRLRLDLGRGPQVLLRLQHRRDQDQELPGRREGVREPRRLAHRHHQQGGERARLRTGGRNKLILLSRLHREDENCVYIRQTNFAEI